MRTSRQKRKRRRTRYAREGAGWEVRRVAGAFLLAGVCARPYSMRYDMVAIVYRRVANVFVLFYSLCKFFCILTLLACHTHVQQ